MMWGILVTKNGVIREYENSGEGLDQLLEEIRSVLAGADGYIRVQIDIYGER